MKILKGADAIKLLEGEYRIKTLKGADAIKLLEEVR